MGRNIKENAIKEHPPDERYQRRQQEAKPVIEKPKPSLEKPASGAAANGDRQGLHYLQAQWHRLVRYLNDDTYPIDNNRAENAIRPFTVGRKNWLFANSQAKANAGANLYSLIETAKANVLNPYDYLKTVCKKLLNAQSVEAIEALLP